MATADKRSWWRLYPVYLGVSAFVGVLTVAAREVRRGGASAVLPFTLALLRYAMDIDAGNAGEPEDVVLNDRVLQALAVLWLIPLGVGIFLP